MLADGDPTEGIANLQIDIVAVTDMVPQIEGQYVWQIKVFDATPTVLRSFVGNLRVIRRIGNA